MEFTVESYTDFGKAGWKGDAMNVFDVDDTLIVTDAQIHVYDPITKKKFSLTPQEYNDFKAQKHQQMDFSDFDKIEIMRKGIIVDWVFTILKKTMIMKKAVGIITARNDAKLIRQFFLEQGIDINPKFIFAVGGPHKDSVAQRKKDAFKKLVTLGFKRFQYFDDDKSNIKLAKTLEDDYDDVTVKTKLIKGKHLPQLKKDLKQIEK